MTTIDKMIKKYKDFNLAFNRYSLYDRLNKGGEYQSGLKFFFSYKGQKNVWSFLCKLIIGAYKKYVTKEISFVVDYIFRQDDYINWTKSNFVSQKEISLLKQKQGEFSFRPKISIILPVYNPPEDFFVECLDSVLNQIYTNWELCIADDVSPNENIRTIIKSYSEKDNRIKYVFREQNGHISASSNSAIEIATGEYLALLDHDDLLTPDALYENVLALNNDSEVDFIYSDEDKVNQRGEFMEGHFKPDYSPDNFLNRNYICHFSVIKTSIVKKIGGFRIGCEGSQDYDIFLRVTEVCNKVYHIPKILYHWRIHSGSTAGDMGAKPYAVNAGVKSLNDMLVRRNLKGVVSGLEEMSGHYKIDYEIEDKNKVSIIIVNKECFNLNALISSIFEITVYNNFEIIVITPRIDDIIEKWRVYEPDRFKVTLSEESSYNDNINLAVTFSSGDYLVFIDNNLEIRDPNWINSQIQLAQTKRIGAVGVKILNLDNTILHAGIVIGLKGLANFPFIGFHKNSHSYLNFTKLINNFSAVSSSCLMVKKSTFIEVGGFSSIQEKELCGIDFCLKIKEKGYDNVFTPYVEVYHKKQEQFFVTFNDENDDFRNNWLKYIENDPCYNMNLSLEYPDFRVRT